jgi:hypothetical protein
LKGALAGRGAARQLPSIAWNWGAGSGPSLRKSAFAEIRRPRNLKDTYTDHATFHPCCSENSLAAALTATGWQPLFSCLVVPEEHDD